MAGSIDEETSDEALRSVAVVLYKDSLRQQAIGVDTAIANKFVFFESTTCPNCLSTNSLRIYFLISLLEFSASMFQMPNSSIYSNTQ